MQPILNPVANQNDWVFLNRWVVKDFKNIKRGEIVSLICPRNPDSHIIKRVIGKRLYAYYLSIWILILKI